MKTLKKRTPTNPPSGKPMRKPGREEREDLPRGSLRLFQVGSGLPNLSALQEEIQDYWDVLLGRVEPPLKLRDRTLALMECADAFHSRALEIKSHIQNLESEGKVLKGTSLYHFRTGTLQNFIDMSRKASDLGSRRLTEMSLRTEAEQRGREYD